MNFLKDKVQKLRGRLKRLLESETVDGSDCGNHSPPTKEDTERWTNTFQYFWNLEELE